MNQVNLVGRLTRDPELKTTPDNRSVCELRVAVSDGRDDKYPLYVDVTTFDKQAEACAEYLGKGRQVAVSGKLVYREWEKDGERRSKHSVMGRVEFLSTGNGNGNGTEPVAVGAESPEGGEDVAPEDIPF